VRPKARKSGNLRANRGRYQRNNQRTDQRNRNLAFAVCQIAHIGPCNRPADRLALDRRRGNRAKRRKLKANTMSDATARLMSAIAAKSAAPVTRIEPKAKSKRADLDWSKIDLDTLPTEAREAWDNYKAAKKFMAEEMAKVRLILTKLIDPKDNEELVVNDYYGDLSMAIKPREAKRATGAISLADFKAKA